MQHTTNLNLNLPEYNEAADIQVINGNMNTIDAAIAETKSNIGIVEDGDAATHSIAAGQYVIWKDALYTASSAIAIGTTLSTSNLTAVSNGGLNSLNEQTTTIKNTISTMYTATIVKNGAHFSTPNANWQAYGNVYVPAYGYVIGTSYINYNATAPQNICLTTSATVNNSIIIAGDQSKTIMTFCYFNNSPNTMILYCWGKWASAGSNYTETNYIQFSPVSTPT